MFKCKRKIRNDINGATGSLAHWIIWYAVLHPIFVLMHTQLGYCNDYQNFCNFHTPVMIHAGSRNASCALKRNLLNDGVNATNVQDNTEISLPHCLQVQ